MTTQAKSGKSKRYGPKMSNPRIRASKEHRNCGPLGRYIQYQKWLDDPNRFHRPAIMPHRNLY